MATRLFQSDTPRRQRRRECAAGEAPRSTRARAAHQRRLVAEGRGGAALIFCHAGYEMGAVMSSEGMSARDLFVAKQERRGWRG
jgi:hypothetical protein